MFTGIIETVGQLIAKESVAGDMRLTISAPDMDWQGVLLGDSIATNGVCLTVVSMASNTFTVDVSLETIEHTTIAEWRVGRRLNLEQALTPTKRLGGHMVSGHVDGVGEVLERSTRARSEIFRVAAPKHLAKYIAQKGSITIDGTSLTVNAVDDHCFDVNIVPHTIQHTVIGDYQAGSLVHLEVDLIARYIERLLTATDGLPEKGGISEAFLQDNGFFNGRP